MRFFFQKGCSYCLQSWSNSSTSNTILGYAHSFACSAAFRYPSVIRFIVFFQTHWPNICSVSALLLDWFYYIYFKINSYARSLYNKQIFAIALYLHKLMCSSGTSKGKYYRSPFCCSHSQMTRKSVKMLNLRHPESPSQQHYSPCSQSMPFAGAALFKQGEAKIKGRVSSQIPLIHRYLSSIAAIHSLIIHFKCFCW